MPTITVTSDNISSLTQKWAEKGWRWHEYNKGMPVSSVDMHTDYKERHANESCVPCSHCGQWAAAKTECRHCGAAV